MTAVDPPRVVLYTCTIARALSSHRFHLRENQFARPGRGRGRERRNATGGAAQPKPDDGKETRGGRNTREEVKEDDVTRVSRNYRREYISLRCLFATCDAVPRVFISFMLRIFLRQPPAICAAPDFTPRGSEKENGRSGEIRIYAQPLCYVPLCYCPWYCVLKLLITILTKPLSV